MALLDVSSICVRYNGAEALKHICLEIEVAEIVALIGANGAGKTTTLKAISGMTPPTEGIISLKGVRIDGKGPREIAKLGIAHVMEGKRLFPRMTVLENLEMGAFLRSDKKAIKADLQRIYEYFPILELKRKQKAGDLSGGEQQMLSLARGLIAKPSLLMIDEPTMGIAPIVVQSLENVLNQINDEGETILLVEQNASIALKLAKRGYVMETGEIVMSGRTEELLGNEYVRKAYLG